MESEFYLQARREWDERYDDYFKHVARALLGWSARGYHACAGSLDALLNAAYEARGNMNGRILFLLDEVARLGYMGILETARDAGRTYGINLLLLYQSLGQMTGTWGTQGRQAWFDSSYLKMFACLHDVSAAEFLSKACGEFTAVSEGYTHGAGTSTGSATSKKSTSTNETTSEQQLVRRLIKPKRSCRRFDTTSRSF
ncbi:MAG: type IV secretory system conjugative DNA transfer family protein [Candidatus Binataceae bacterium]|nr:type IV secretory system conjugative DNA transfer family protein [Candidatus Binataceae bacterium]